MPTVYTQEFKQLALRLMEDHLHHTQCSQWSAAPGGGNETWDLTAYDAGVAEAGQT